MRKLVLGVLLFSSNAYSINMVAFGDSISQGTNSVVLGSNPERSWTTGTKVRSHLVKLLEQGNDVQVINASVNGAESSDLGSELDSIGDFVPDYATLEIGANDVCNGFHPGTSENVDRFLTSLTARNPLMKVVMVPVPRLISLLEANQGRAHCRVRWNLFKVCQPFLAPDADPEAAQASVDQLNDRLAEVAAKHPQVRFDRTIGDYVFSQDDIGNIDCFHPSEEGQQLLSDLTFPK